MRLSSLFLTGLSLSLLAACGSDTASDDTPVFPGGNTSAGGSGGTGGSGGSAGTDGGNGVGGSTGSGTFPGGAGSSGTAGAAGNGSSGPGTAGTTGSEPGQGGAAGTGGSSPPANNPIVTCSDVNDCLSNGTKKHCDLTTGMCVGCFPFNDTCGPGTYCDSATKVCMSGCKEDNDCGGALSVCDPLKHKCVVCALDAQCPEGSLCVYGGCAVGCSDAKPCQDNTASCCNGTCHYLTAELNNCGSCGTVCLEAANRQAFCNFGTCELSECAPGFADCDGDMSNGCEVNTALQGACVCAPGSTKPCYEGPSGTQNKGICKGGVQVCSPSGLGYIPGCQGQVLPEPEVCGDGLDHDCDGLANNVPDIDGDGWTLCTGDCCEYTYQCSDPKLVNPGAYDVPGNGVDDDCDGVEGPVVCNSTTQKFTGVTGNDLAVAMELCETTTESPAALKDKKWGVISAQLLLANGATPTAAQLANLQNWQSAVLTDYGVNGPRKGKTMVGMSSGRMRDAGDSGFVAPDIGTLFGVTSTPPAAYLAAHNGSLVASQGCKGACLPGAGANDSVLLRLRMRVPTNAQSLSYDFRFFSTEYWTYQCTAFNDFFLTQLQSSAAGIPADRNISFDSKNNPVSVNNGFFEVCYVKGCNTCPQGTGDLSGTGMATMGGGATKWLTTVSPVKPGEVITLDFMIFDVSDTRLDSLALIDNFSWLATPSSGPTTSPAQ